MAKIELILPAFAGCCGMAGSFAWIGGMLFTLLIGQSADAYGYDPLFVALAALDLVGAAVLWGMLRGSKRQAA